MHLPYYEYRDFIDEWQEYIKLKLQAQKDREAEAKKQKSQQEANLRSSNRGVKPRKKF